MTKSPRKVLNRTTTFGDLFHAPHRKGGYQAGTSSKNEARPPQAQGQQKPGKHRTGHLTKEHLQLDERPRHPTRLQIDTPIDQISLAVARGTNAKSPTEVSERANAKSPKEDCYLLRQSYLAMLKFHF